jgi:preprotein translocase subunit SecD
VPKTKKAAVYVKPPPCGASYRYTTATYSTASSSNPGSPPDPALNSAPTTPPSQDKASRVVLICASTLTPCPARYELGTTPYDGTVPATGEILASANAELQTTAGWVVNFTIKSQYSAFFDTVAKKNYHLPLAIDLGGQVESAPTINAMSFGGSGEISGDFTQPQAQALALVLKYGQIPIALTQAIYAIISLLGATSAGLTLDLSGMTGLIVSVGITVDSYVVYFERLKDEVRAGRSIRSSVDRGFKSAYRTILSADAVSFLGALVLWLLSIGAVRGFAFMLGLSTIVDVITAYTFTRPLVILLGRNRVFTNARGFGVASGLAAATEVGS